MTALFNLVHVLTKYSSIKFMSDDPGVLIDRGIQFAANLAKQERYDDAIEILKQVLRADPSNGQANHMLKSLQNFSNNDEEVLAFYRAALKISPNCHITLNNLGLRLAQMGRCEEALPYAIEATEIEDANPAYWNNLGLIYKKLNITDHAVRCFEYSLKMDRDPFVLINLGSALADELKLEEAIKTFHEALEIRSGISGAHINLAYCYHLLGNPQKGWEHYEHRLRHYHQLIAYLSLHGEERKWGGTSSLEGKRLVAFCEQGLGDAIQASRYFPDLKKLGCHLIVQCNESLMPLFKLMPEVDHVESKGCVSEFDYHVPTMSLPLLLGKPIPTGKPYISVQTEPIQSDKLRVGITWQGSKLHPGDQYRSCGFSYFEPLLSMPGIRWFNIQPNPCDHPSIINTELNNFLDTAKLISTLDLIISVDTAVLHLAGAMGKESWGLVTYRPDFRWGLESKTDWYDSVRLIRQPSNGDWQGVFDEVRTRLHERTRVA